MCARREAREELGVEIAAWEWDGVIVGPPKMQPVALITGKVDGYWEDYEGRMYQAPDWAVENRQWLALTSQDLRQHLCDQIWSVAARLHIQRRLRKEGTPCD